jgi:hypothetical protein
LSDLASIQTENNEYEDDLPPGWTRMDVESPGGFAYECTVDAPGDDKGLTGSLARDKGNRTIRFHWAWRF